MRVYLRKHTTKYIENIVYAISWDNLVDKNMQWTDVYPTKYKLKWKVKAIEQLKLEPKSGCETKGEVTRRSFQRQFLDNSRIFGQLKIRCITLLPTLCIISTINFISTKLETFLLFESDAWQHLNFNIISSFVISQYNKQCNAWRTYGNLRIVYVSLLVFSSLKYVCQKKWEDGPPQG